MSTRVDLHHHQDIHFYHGCRPFLFLYIDCDYCLLQILFEYLICINVYPNLYKYKIYLLNKNPIHTINIIDKAGKSCSGHAEALNHFEILDKL